MLGAIIGDIVGSAYEFNNIKTTDFPFFSKASNYTDDTVMTFAVYDWLSSIRHDPHCHETLEGCLVSFADMFPCPMGGYGGKFRKWLFHPEELPPYDGTRKPYNSWGNGSAMRVSSVGWMCNTIEEAENVAKCTAEITHNHPEGIKGAQATAVAILLARQSMTKEQIRNILEQRYGYNLHRTCDEIRPTYKFDESCQGTVPEAIICFLESTDFESAIRLAVSLGGDSDTLACITGGIAEAYYNDIPTWMREEVSKRLHHSLNKMLDNFEKDKKSYEEGLANMNRDNREQLQTKYLLDAFYEEMAKEEGSILHITKQKEIRLLDFIVAGTTFCKKFQKQDDGFIKNGMTLRVEREKDNKHDANAIALYVEDIKVGYVPKAQNTVLANLIDAGKFLISRVRYGEYNEGWQRIDASIYMVEL